MYMYTRVVYTFHISWFFIRAGFRREGPCADFSIGAVEAHPTLEYQKIKHDKKYVEAPAKLAQS